MWNLRELGLSDLGALQLDELVNRVLPRLSPQEAPLPLGGQTAWRTSHLSTHSFFYNKHGEKIVINWPLILCLVPLGVLAAGAHVMVPVTSRFLLVTQHTWLLTSLTLLEDYQNLRTPSSSFMNNYNML